MAAWGAWSGSNKRGVGDLVSRIQANDPKLTSLCVISSMRTVGPADAATIADALRSNSVLEELLLSGHAIGAEGAAALGAALAGVDGNIALRRLCLGAQTFGDAGAAALASSMAAWNTLEDLDLELKGITATGASHLGGGLAKNTSVKKLNMSRNELLDSGVAGLLETCWVTPGGDGTDPDPVCELLELHLSETSCGLDGLNMIGVALSRPRCTLRVLKCDKNPGIGTKVDGGCGGGSGGDDDEHPLANLLRAGSLPSSSSTRGLLSLSLAKCKLGDAGLIRLCKGLAVNRSLVKLDLGYNGTGPDGCRALAAALTQGGAPDLTTLVLRMNNAGPDGGVAIASALQARSTLHFVLDFCSNKIGLLGAVAAASIPGMGDLNMMDCDLGDQGALALADALRDNDAILAQTLRALNLCANDLGDVSVLKVCQALEVVYPLDACAEMDASGSKPLIRFVLGIGANARLGAGSRDAAAALLEGRSGFQVVQGKAAGHEESNSSACSVNSGDDAAEAAMFQDMLSRIGRKE